MSDQHPSRELDKVIIRLPDGMKERIRRVATEHGRSVNAELVMLLERTYPPETKLEECVHEIADLIGKLPTENRDEAWRSVFEKLECMRSSE